jgi:dolichyl-phosphate-mannose--protein O-mannosyl transferase
MGFALSDLKREKSKEALVIVVGFLAQLLPWLFISRYTFIYHYFPSVIFLTLAICYVFKNILERAPERKWRVYLFTGVSVGLFFLMFPLVAGLWMPDW